MPIVRYVAILLGWLMNGIFEVLDRIGIPNIGIAIIFFTIIIYMLMLPIQISQQKSSKLMSVIQPEMQKIQKKYEGKRDQASQMKMQEELSTLYSRYGYSPTGTCLPLLVQMPLLFGLYQVILYIPGYVTKVGAIFTDVASKIVSVSGYDEIIRTFVSDNRVRVALGNEITTEKVIDFLYALKPSQWLKLQDISQFSGFSSEIADTAARSERINSFLTINISDSPWDAVMSSINSIRSGSASG
ncbi:MAG TPA: stage III sporulation protein J, partial [Lachnospiraceae bacterium]|nr:stage III sporulation protein J [Lachnospiraceae bacterium]